VKTPTETATELADQVLPTDRLYRNIPVRAAAALVAELVRRLNLATQAHSYVPLEQPADVDELLAELALTFERVPQLLDQLGARLGRWQEDPDVYTTRPEHTASSTIALVTFHLGATRTAIMDAARSVRTAQGLTSTLGIDDQD
jgi:hypothetical protein